VATLLEKLQFQQLVEETLTVKRETRAMPMYQFVLAMVLALYVGFSRLPSSAISGTRADVDGHSEGVAIAAWHVYLCLSRSFPAASSHGLSRIWYWNFQSTMLRGTSHGMDP